MIDISNLSLIVFSGFNDLLKIFTPFWSDLSTFLQTIGSMGIPCMIGYYKIREAFADVQQDQMYSQKTKAVMLCLIFIFLAPTIVNIIQHYFMK